MAAEAGLKPWETDMIAPSDVWVMIEGYNGRQKAEWERVRMNSYHIHVHSMIDKRYKKRKPTEFWPFPWDSDYRPRTSAKEILRQHRERIEKLKDGSN